MSNDNSQKIIVEKIKETLKPYPDAAAFVDAFSNYIHDIDDIIDEPAKRSTENILRVFASASVVFTYPFWQQYGDKLLLVEQMINNTYTDTTIMEKSVINWHLQDARALRHCGIDMLYAVILLMCGREKLRELSLDFRKHCHEQHMDENGNSI